MNLLIGTKEDALTNIRVYKKMDDVGLGLTIEEVMKDEEFKQQYEKWLSANKEKLEEKIELLN